MKQLIQTILMLFFCTNLQAQTSNTKAIVGATLVDVNGQNNIPNSVVVITGERISQIGSEKDVRIPNGAEIINGEGKWLIPGLLNMHVHLGLILPGKMEAELANETDGELTLRMAAAARETLLAGMTTVRLVGEPRHGDFALRKAIRKGHTIGPRIYTAGEAIYITGGHGADREKVYYDGPDELMKATRKEISSGASWIKILISGGISTDGGAIAEPLMTPEEIEAVIDVAHRFDAKVTAHSGSPIATEVAVNAGIDCIEHGYFLTREVLQLMKEKGTWYVPTILISSPSIDAFLTDVGAPQWFFERKNSVGKSHWNAFKMAIEEDVKIVFGSDQIPAYPTEGTTASVRELEYFQEAGMTPLKVLQVATIDPAKMLEADNNIGSVEEGKYADILLIDENPLEDISALRNISLVMKGGKIYRNELDD